MLESTLNPVTSATSTMTSVVTLTLAVTSDLVLVRPTSIESIMRPNSTESIMSPTTEPPANTSAFFSSTMTLSVTGTQAVPLATLVSNRLGGPIATTAATSVMRSVSGVSRTTAAAFTDNELLTSGGLSLGELIALAVGASFSVMIVIIACFALIICALK